MLAILAVSFQRTRIILNSGFTVMFMQQAFILEEEGICWQYVETFAYIKSVV